MHDVTHAPRLSIPSPTLLAAYTHVRRDAFLLVTGWERAGAHEFTLDVRWPAVHLDQLYDPRLLAQTIRQSGLTVVHAEYQVPLTHQTMLETLDFTVSPDFRAPRGRPFALEVRVTVSKPTGSRRTARSLRMDIHILRDGVTAARADTEFGWISPAVYQRVRGARHAVDWGVWPLPAPVPAELVGRSRAADVVLAAGDAPHRWLLRNDIGNHLLFDHPVDHVPGLALLEAADQAARALEPRTPFVTTGVSTVYSRYVEFDQPCWIEARRLPSGPDRRTVRVTGTQGGERAFQVELSGIER